MVLNAVGEDLTDVYNVIWADDDTSQVGVAVRDGDDRLVVITLDVPGLRFIPAVSGPEFIARCACGNEKIMARGLRKWADVIVPGFDLEDGLVCDFTEDEPVVEFVRCPACRGGVA